MFGLTRLPSWFFPSFCYESKGWSSSKQSPLISSMFLLLIVTAAAVYSDVRFTQSHCLIQCFCCPGSMSLTLLMPETTFLFRAGCWPNMTLCLKLHGLCPMFLPQFSSRKHYMVSLWLPCCVLLLSLLEVCLQRLSWQNKGKTCSVASSRHFVNVFAQLHSSWFGC